MNAFYAENTKNKIYVPTKSMICAVQHENNWQRGRIDSVSPDRKCNVWLMDCGFSVTEDWSKLRYLDDEFVSLNEGVIICMLSSIAPKCGNEFTAECNDYLSSAHHETVLIHVDYVRATMHEVTLNMNTADNTWLHLNSHLVENGLAISTGIKSIRPENRNERISEWLQMDIIQDKPVAFNEITKQDVIIKKYISPDEFYIQFVERKEALKQLQDQLQVYASKMHATGELGKYREWKNGEKCMVRAALYGKPIQWFRGCVVNTFKFATFAYTVNLVDEGETLYSVQFEDMAQLDGVLADQTYGAIKCHLSMVGPSAGIQYTQTATDAFHACLQRFNALAALMIEGNESKGVIIYGQRITEGDALMPSQHDWVNINDHLVSTGLMQPTNDDLSRSESQKSIEHVIGPEYNIKRRAALVRDHNQPAQGDLSSIDADDEISYGLKAWKPNVPVKREVMNVYITFVDNKLNFYGHHAEQKEQIDHMTKKINKHIEQLSAERYDGWQKHQPCLAKYQDGKYYRAEVLHIDTNKKICHVQFIDYGDKLAVKFNAMRNVTMFADVPKQACVYYFRNLRSTTDDNLWPRQIVEHCYKLLYDKLCSVRIEPGFWQDDNIPGPVPFAISTAASGGDLRFYLINQGFAKSIVTRQINPEPVKEEHAPSECASAIVALPKHIDINSLQCSDDFKLAYERQVASDSDRRDELVDVRSGKNVDFFGESTDSVIKRLPSGIRSFEPKTSTVTYGSFIYESMEDEPVFDMFLKNYKQLKLDPNLNEFYCDVRKLVNATHLLISPMCDRYEEQHSEMTAKIQNRIETISVLADIRVGQHCLALSHRFNEWYRALVLEVDKSNDSYRVVFVDYYYQAIVRADELRHCSREYMGLPVHVMPVKLSGIQRNARLRTRDIKERLQEILLKKENHVFARVIKRGEIPEVQLFWARDMKELIYMNMFSERYYRHVA